MRREMQSYSTPEINIYRCDYVYNCANWNFKDVSAPYWRFYWVANSGGEIFYNNKRLVLKPDFFVLIPANTCFSTKAHTAFEQFYVHFTAASPFDRVIDDIYTFQMPGHIYSKIQELKKLIFAEHENTHFELMVFSLVYDALLDIPKDAFTADKTQYDPRIVKVIDLLDKNTSWVFTNEDLASKINMSVNGFIRLFSTEIGISPLQYSRRKRVEKACLLLHFSKLSIDEIARKTGFQDRYYFSRVFKQVTNFSPAQYRSTQIPFK
jgi:AraC-like DNA-binding protein